MPEQYDPLLQDLLDEAFEQGAEQAKEIFLCELSYCYGEEAAETFRTRIDSLGLPR